MRYNRALASFVVFLASLGRGNALLASRRALSAAESVSLEEVHNLGFAFATPEVINGTREFVTIAGAASRRKPVMWVHVHKNAGATMCRLARNGGNERIVDPDDGTCNSRKMHDCFFPDGIASRPRWYTCEARAALFAKRGWTWGQIEREVSEGDFCPDNFIYGITMRDTLDRLESYVNWNQQKVGGHKYKEWMACIDQKNIFICPYNRTQRLKEAINFGYQQYDNYVVRTLGGFWAMVVPPGGLNETHLAHAMDMLSKFDLVVPIEMFGSAKANEDMARVIGWHPNPTRVLLEHQNPHKTQFTSEDRANWARINRFDIALYDHFAKRYHEHQRATTD